LCRRSTPEQQHLDAVFRVLTVQAIQAMQTYRSPSTLPSAKSRACGSTATCSRSAARPTGHRLLTVLRTSTFPQVLPSRPHTYCHLAQSHSPLVYPPFMHLSLTISIIVRHSPEPSEPAGPQPLRLAHSVCNILAYEAMELANASTVSDRCSVR
jgi:hypothetical protein